MALVPWEESVKKERSILADSHLETLPLPVQRAAGTDREAGGAWILLAKYSC